MNDRDARGAFRRRTRGGAWGLFVLAALGLVLVACASPHMGRPGDRELETSVNAPADPDQDPHEALFALGRFPSAAECRKCHEEHYRQWSVSPHAYAQLSPVFNAMQGRMNQLMNGTLGDFCIRCHTPVGMALEEPTFMPNLERDPVSREGVTCIVCHRVNQDFGKASGRRAIVEGTIHDPVMGPTGNEELGRVLESEDYFVNPGEEGRRGADIHAEAERFFTLVEPGFCASCHDVNLPNGFRLEEAFSEFKGTPAAKRGESCQDCHMSTDPGRASGFREGPAAVVEGIPTRPRKLTDHMFIGPDVSVVHPALFPHNPDLQSFATLDEWMDFDHEAGWGTDDFEDALPENARFPARWSSRDDREYARELLEEQFELLDLAREKRLALLQKGYLLHALREVSSDADGLRFEAVVKNGTDAHSVPTGFTAERLVWLEVTVRAPDDSVVFRSGDLDPNGDVRDLHSVYVHNGELPVDEQLFSLQSKFITETLRGGEREQVLAVNHSLDALPFLRPETLPSTLTGRPRGARIHKYGIEPNGERKAPYHVAKEALKGAGNYEATVRLKAAMVPVNLIDAIQPVGFDYGLSPRQIADRIVAEHLVLAEKTLTLTVP